MFRNRLLIIVLTLLWAQASSLLMPGTVAAAADFAWNDGNVTVIAISALILATMALWLGRRYLRSNPRARSDNDSPTLDFESIFERSPDAAWIIRGKRFVACNDATVALLGCDSRAEVLGKHPADISPPKQPDGQDSQSKAEAMIALAFEKGVHRFEWVHARVDGSEVYTEITLSIMHTHAEPLIYCVGRDITDRHLAQRELDQQHNVLQGILESLPVRVFWKDRHLNYLGCNTLFALDAGFEHPAELIGHDDYQMGWRQQAEAYRLDDRRVIESGVPKIGYEEPQSTPSGAAIWLRTSKVPLRDDSNRIFGVLGIYEDVTVQKRSQELLQRSQLDLQRAQSVAHMGSWHFDVATECYTASAEASAILGLSDEAPVSQELINSCIHPEDRPRVLDAQAAAMAGAPYDIEFRLIVDGREKWVHSRAEAVFGCDGRIVSATGTLQDITARKRAQEELSESERRLHLALNVARMGVWDYDLQNGQLYWSPEIFSVFGLEPFAPTLERFREILHPEDAARVEEEFQRALGTGSNFASDFRVRLPDGRIRWISDRGEIQFDRNGRPQRVIGTAQDITDRIRMEAELRETLDKFRLLYEKAPLGIVLCNMDGRYVQANDAFLDIIGYRSDEAFSLSYWDITPNDYELDELAQLRSLADTGRYGPYEKELVHRLGHRVPVLLNGSVITGADGGRYILSIVEDITERKLAEEALRRNEQQLEELVRERTEELMQARLEAERMAQVKADFLARMSHEIRTPLNAVLGMAQIGLRDFPDGETAPTFKRILDSGRHLLGVINDILDFSKIEAGKLAIESRPFELDELIDGAVDLVRQRASEKALELTVERAVDLPHWVSGDPLRLEQVLANLLSNAVKFTERGEVCLLVARRADWIDFRVEDTGIGIDDEQLSRLFTPFEQADGSITRKYGGTGLGLAISKSLAEMMGGRITVQSAPTAGSVFVLSIPLVAASPVSPQDSGTLSGRDRLEGLRVLAAEDVEVNRIVLEDMLSYEGAVVTFAENGLQALRQVVDGGADAFDVVLMDIQMPEMNGHEAAQRIREIAPLLPIIGLTAHAMDDERRRCLESGMVTHLTKPIDADTLVETIRSCLSVGSGARGAGQQEPRRAREPDVRPALVDWNAITARFEGRVEAGERLLRATMENGPQFLRSLLDAIDRQDAPAVAFVAHDLKSTAGWLCAKAVAELAQNTEFAAKAAQEGYVDLALELAARWTDLLDEVVAHLQAGQR